MCAHVFGEVNVEETPFLADLRAWDFSGLGAGLQGVFVEAEEIGGGFEVEGVHAAVAPTLGNDFRSPAKMRDHPMRSFHGLPSTWTR